MSKSKETPKLDFANITPDEVVFMVNQYGSEAIALRDVGRAEDGVEYENKRLFLIQEYVKHLESKFAMPPSKDVPNIAGDLKKKQDAAKQVIQEAKEKGETPAGEEAKLKM